VDRSGVDLTRSAAVVHLRCGSLDSNVLMRLNAREFGNLSMSQQNLVHSSARNAADPAF
jgi:hypothetical protein